MSLPPWISPCQAELLQAFADQRLGHAPLVQGPAGVGKRLLAGWLVKRLLCLDSDGVEPCGSCRSCQLIEAGTHPDLFQVGLEEERSQILVDQIRRLAAGLVLTPGVGQYRVGLIDGAELMNQAAANALLKTLEEPSPGVWLVLVSDQPALLPATIRSRCQAVAVRPPAEETARKWLAECCPEASPDDIEAALAFTGGAPLMARDLIVSGELALGEEVLEVLLGQRDADVSVLDTASRWAQAPTMAWRWLAHWTAAMMRAGSGTRQRAGNLELPTELPPRQLARLWDSALEGCRLSQGSIRQELLLGRWLLEWRQIQAR